MKKTCVGFVYKFWIQSLKSCGGAIDSRLQTIAMPYVRPISRSTQSFAYDEKTAPVGVPTEKISGFSQACGDALYTDDKRNPSGGLYASFVISEIANGEIEAIDASLALTVPGVVDVISANDVSKIPGCTNNCGMFPGDETILAPGTVRWLGQPICLVIAEKPYIADHAAKLVSISYKSINEPVVSIQQAIKQKSFFEPNEFQDYLKELRRGNVELSIRNAIHVLSGSIECPTQAHFYMETHAAAASLLENGTLKVLSSSQSPSWVQSSLAITTGLPCNKILVETTRCGGGKYLDFCFFVNLYKHLEGK
jgi:xanthine dehydrogenase molybdopterin-binding subunit B